MNPSSPDTSGQFVKKSEFARLINRSRSQISRLNEKGLLVMVGDKVDVASTKALIEANNDPQYQHLSDRWEQYRTWKAQNTADNAQGAPKTTDTNLEAGLVYRIERAKKLRLEREMLENEKALSEGELLEKRAVLLAVSDAATVVRSRLEAIPDTLSAQLSAETDESIIHGILYDMAEGVLLELSRQFEKIGDVR